MKRSLTLLFLAISLCACEEKVYLYEYQDLQKQLSKAQEDYDDLFRYHNELQQKYTELTNYVQELEEQQQEQYSRVRYARSKVKTLKDEHESLAITGHWALDFNDIANDAEDVKKGLNGLISMGKVRIKGGIRY